MKAINLDIHNTSTQRALKNYLMRYMSALDYVKVGCKILDVPSGTGWGLKFLSVMSGNENAYGLEFDDDCYNYSREKFPELPNIIQSDMRKTLPYKDNFFDAVTCFEGIEHIGEPEGVHFVTEVKRILKPDGMFIGSTPDHRLTNNLITPEEEHCCLYSRDKLIELLKILSGGSQYLAIRNHVLKSTFSWMAWNKKNITVETEKERMESHLNKFNKGRKVEK